jgi:hypothetical protein
VDNELINSIDVSAVASLRISPLPAHNSIADHKSARYPP